MSETAQRRRPVDHRPAPVDPTRKERGVLVLWRHDRAKLSTLGEVVAQRERDERTASAVGGIGDRPCIELRQPGQARVLAAPDLLRAGIRLRRDERRLVKSPTCHAVAAACGQQVRDTAQVLDPDQQQRLTTDEPRPGVEDGVRAIWQLVDGDDRVERVPGEDVRRLEWAYARSSTSTGTP